MCVWVSIGLCLLGNRGVAGITGKIAVAVTAEDVLNQRRIFLNVNFDGQQPIHRAALAKPDRQNQKEQWG